MTGTLDVGGEAIPLRIRTTDYGPGEQEYVRIIREAVVMSGPGVLPLSLRGTGLTRADLERLTISSSIQLDLNLEVLHASQPLRIQVSLQQDGEWLSQQKTNNELNRWTALHEGLRT